MFEGIILGILTFVGFWAIYRKLPIALKKVIGYKKTVWIIDILLTVGFYLLLSGISSSFGGAIGCAIAGILVSLYLESQGGNLWKGISQKTQTPPIQPQRK